MQLIVNFLLTTGILILALMSFLLLKKKGGVLPRKILGCIFILLFLVTVHSYGELNNISLLIWVGFPTTDSIGFLIGPLLYFYVIALFKSKPRQPKRIALHLIPAGLNLLFISLPFLISMIQGSYIFKFLHFIDRNEYLLHFQAVYLLFYCLWSLNRLSTFHMLSKAYYSNLKKIDIQWIRFLLWGIIIVMIVDLCMLLFSSSNINIPVPGDQVITMTMVFLIIYLAYFGTQQSQILLPEYIDNKAFVKEQKNKTPTHHLINATPEEILDLKNRLHEVLKNQRPYTNESLTLATLAKLLPTTDRKLSALLNHYLNTSFYDLVNTYRVQEVKEKMKLPNYNKLTLLAIAFEAGFNSKTSFNRIFKKETGLSPTAYKKSLEE